MSNKRSAAGRDGPLERTTPLDIAIEASYSAVERARCSTSLALSVRSPAASSPGRRLRSPYCCMQAVVRGHRYGPAGLLWSY